jgi:hypothetical protein
MKIAGNIEKSRQYNKFESIFSSPRREDIISITQNMSKDQVIAILDSYDEMIHTVYPDIIEMKECIKRLIDRGDISINIKDIDNAYRTMAASTIEVVENQLYDALPESQEDNDCDDYNMSLSKICGETYYELEDSLTELFKNYKY